MQGTTNQNHWAKGPDGEWGIPGIDDDGNQILDDAATSPPFEPGNGDDINLSELDIGIEWMDTGNTWPDAWPRPSPVSVFLVL